MTCSKAARKSAAGVTVTPSTARPRITAPSTSLLPIHTVTKLGPAATACATCDPRPRRTTSWKPPVSDVRDRASTTVALGTARLLNARARPELRGAPAFCALGATMGVGTSRVSAYSGGSPGSVISGCWKSATPACRARCAGTEWTWCVSTSELFTYPAARLSPIE
jgi:hypothetical protein